MDDVALIHQDKEELKRMLNTTFVSELTNRYHIKFGKENSQLMIINGKTPSTEITIGEQVLEKKQQYVQIPRYDHK